MMASTTVLHLSTPMGTPNCQCEGIGELTSCMPTGVVTSRAILLLIALTKI